MAVKPGGLKVLVVGGGGREHALVWKIRQSPRVAAVYCAPGNAGISLLAECVPLQPGEIGELADFAASAGIDLTVVGPEEPLVAGITDHFEARGLAVFGPSAAAARIEGSKVFAKDLMRKYGLPTAAHAVFDRAEEAKEYIRARGAPLVVKAEGLAAGKGVVVAEDEETALRAVERIMEEGVFGPAGRRVVIEDRLEGEEVSVLAFTDGRTVVPMVPSQDHKRALDGDRGPNTGGMGAYSPPPWYGPDLADRVCRDILVPAVGALAAEGCYYRGVLYAGLMVTAEGPQVLEFNARFGDPETQVVLPRLRSDLVDVMEAVVEGGLDAVSLDWAEESAVCVVLASGGYPGAYEKGKAVSGWQEASSLPGTVLFHAGTAWGEKDGNPVLVTAGGRVLGVTALGPDLGGAIGRAYEVVGHIHFEGMHYRRDIGRRALVRG